MGIILQSFICLLCISCYCAMESTTKTYPVIGNDYVTLIDSDGSSFEIKRLFPIKEQISSCYMLKKNNLFSQFCYPSILVAGVAKCGTSAMYSFLTNQNGLEQAHQHKEYCPRQTTLYEYFNGFSYKPHAISVNGCLDTEVVQNLHKILQPKAAYIIMVRDLAERIWAAYNFWCIPTHENCDPAMFGWTNKNFYRSPHHFHELIMDAYYNKYSKDSDLWGCTKFNYYFSKPIHSLLNSTGTMPFVLAAEGIESSKQSEHIQRLQVYINTRLNTQISLDLKYLRFVNTGDSKGKVADGITHGVYEVSGHQPMFPPTRGFLSSCWADCKYISQLSNHTYKCAEKIRYG